MKRYTTLGMATDQGKTGGVAGIAVLAALTGRSVAETGVDHVPPALHRRPDRGARGRRRGRRLRAAALHPDPRRDRGPRRADDRGRALVPPELLPRRRARPPGARPATARSRMVRGAVGVCDVSTLGKIDVQGPDAAAFLDRVYANTISTLPVGRVRYGLMLREDGFVMDDGTVARLGERHFLVTTTTAAAGQVMAHLEFAAQCLWPELDVADDLGHRPLGADRRRRAEVARAARTACSTARSTTPASPSWPAGRRAIAGDRRPALPHLLLRRARLRGRRPRPLGRGAVRPPRRARRRRSAAAPTAWRR